MVNHCSSILFCVNLYPTGAELKTWDGKRVFKVYYSNCPNCGYPLRKRGSKYKCPRCGYTWEEETDEWDGSIDNVEKALEDRVSKHGWSW